MTINCTMYDDGKCEAGHYGGTPPVAACRLCQHRRAVEPDQQAVIVPLIVKPATKYAKPKCWTCGSRADAERKNR